MGKPVIFISYSHVDEAWKDRLAKHLCVLQSQEALDYWDDRKLHIGDTWQSKIETVLTSAQAAILLISADFLTSPFIRSAEVPLLLQRRRSDGMPIFPLIIKSCSWRTIAWLAGLQVRPTDGKALAKLRGDKIDETLTNIVEEIAEILRSSPTADVIPTTGPEQTFDPDLSPELGHTCPYRGLEVFREEDGPFFFGREAFAEQLLARIVREKLPFVAVVGASGSGKSSIVQAGVLPRLRHEKAPTWEVAIFTPSTAPFRHLAEALVLVEDPHLERWERLKKAKKWGEDLASGEVSISEAVEITLEASQGAGRLLLVVDQFEELFTLTPEADRKPFCDALLAATQTSSVTVLLTLRADFFSQALSLTRELSNRMQQGIVTLGPLVGSEWRMVIEAPARKVGLRFESGLVNRILRGVESQPDSLPLLEYTLTELWERRQGQLLTHAQYDTIGGVEGAISRKADTVLTDLPEEQREAALKALTKLVQVPIEDEGAHTRRRVGLAELGAASRHLLHEFVNARLLVTSRNEVTDEETIEVAHEALIRRWGKLREALHKDREFLLWQRRLRFRMQEWEAAQRDDGALLQGALWNEAQRWLAERALDLTADERTFITWSERDAYQIEQILLKAPRLVRSSEEEQCEAWFFTLAACQGVEKALSAARELQNVDLRAHALAPIADVLLKTEQPEQALAVTREISEAHVRARVLSTIAAALTKAGGLEQALAVAREISEVDSRAEALSTIAAALTEVRNIEQALMMANEACSIIDSIYDDDDRSEICSNLAGILARLRRYYQARKTADLCSSSDDGLQAYTAILRAYGIEHNPDLAKFF